MNYKKMTFYRILLISLHYGDDCFTKLKSINQNVIDSSILSFNLLTIPFCKMNRIPLKLLLRIYFSDNYFNGSCKKRTSFIFFTYDL